MKRSIAIIVCMCLVGFLSIPKAQAQEAKFKALFLYKFCQYINWPGKDKITLGVLGNSPVLLELQTIKDRGNDKFELVKISGASDAARCDMIFLPLAQSRNFNLIQSGIGSKPVVVVSDDASLAEKGAEISFYIDDGKLKFIMNKQAITKTGVQVSNGLFNIAKII